MNAPLGIHRSARYLVFQENTKVKKEIWNKSEFMKMFAIVPVYSILLVLLDARFVLSNLKDPAIMLGSILSECINYLLGFGLVAFLPIKWEKLKTALSLAIALFLNCFLEVNFNSEFVQQNLPLIIPIFILFILIAFLSTLGKKIGFYFAERGNRVVGIVLTILDILSLIAVVVLYGFYMANYYAYYGFHWTNIVWE